MNSPLPMSAECAAERFRNGCKARERMRFAPAGTMKVLLGSCDPLIADEWHHGYCPLALFAKPSSADRMVANASSRSVMPCRAFSVSGAV